MSAAVVIYTRLSQADAEWTPADGLTAVERQEADCRARAAREGWNIAAVYSDPDASASDARRKRPGFEAMLADLGDGTRADSILCYKLDRLLRQPKETERLLDLADARGIGIVSLSDPHLDLTTPLGRFTFRLGIASARMETETMSLRLRRKFADLAANGNPHGGGRRAFGLSVDHSALVPAEAELIREAARRIIDGDSLRRIALDWEARGIVAPGAGKPWRPAALRMMLRSPRLYGARTHRGDTIEPTGRIPAILERETWDRLQVALGAPRGKIGHRPPRVSYLAGLAVCGRCGATLQTHRGTSRKYSCKAPRGCNGTVVSADPLEALVAEMLAIRLDSDELRAALAAQAERSGTGADLAALRDGEVRLVELDAARFVEGTLDKATWTRLRSELTGRLAVIRRRVTAGLAVGPLAGLAGRDLRAEWQTWDVEKRARIAGLLLSSVVIGPAVRRGTRFDASRVEPIWRV